MICLCRLAKSGYFHHSFPKGALMMNIYVPKDVPVIQTSDALKCSMYINRRLRFNAVCFNIPDVFDFFKNVDAGTTDQNDVRDGYLFIFHEDTVSITGVRYYSTITIKACRVVEVIVAVLAYSCN